MRELRNDPFYELIKEYKGCIIDYCLIEDDTPHQGYRSHKDAILFAMCKVIERYIAYQLQAEIDYYKDTPGEIEEEPFPWSMDIGRAKAERIDSVSFLQEGRTDSTTYRYAFLNTPHKTGYGEDDYDKINSVLFPGGAETLEVYEWTTDWSNYFDAGHEWWGAACWSIYDRSLDRYVVIMASTTD